MPNWAQDVSSLEITWFVSYFIIPYWRLPALLLPALQMVHFEMTDHTLPQWLYWNRLAFLELISGCTVLISARRSHKSFYTSWCGVSGVGVCECIFVQMTDEQCLAVIFTKVLNYTSWFTEVEHTVVQE